jgi:hypothetical protein
MPYIMSVSREVLLAVPNSQREAALALGATRWEAVTGAVLPYARSGIIGAVILGLGRAVGETMAVTMVIGNRHEIAASLFAPGYTMAAAIANEFHRGRGGHPPGRAGLRRTHAFVVTVLYQCHRAAPHLRVARGARRRQQGALMNRRLLRRLYSDAMVGLMILAVVPPSVLPCSSSEPSFPRVRATSASNSSPGCRFRRPGRAAASRMPSSGRS